jgi:uncharacterized protein (DUF302 family)
MTSDVAGSRDGERPGSDARPARAATDYTATRIVHSSVHDFATTRARFDTQVPVLDPEVGAELVMGGAGWDEVVGAVESRVGPGGLVTVARVDHGALLSLSGEPLEATLYLVGNPLVAREITARNPGGALYAPFRVAVFRDLTGVHVAYDQPSTVFASLGSPAINAIADELDRKIAAAARYACTTQQ